ncbi:hypothetical protein ASG60_18970 [Methylobacterium sp. Leaf469]|uniref:hypothetical protein n=1 Tax=Methylobacterium sp. Leaf469 TaxID=1736387 RepID=UPI000702041C|nr:hypothetical protein [Methylobacterium sp. Leaf469]KQU01017.1 hypothetical protein ASG60_18970 [Methylobacterium sp. Leaf469]
MPVESWITPDDTPVFAAQATDRIDVALARLGEAERAAFWASVRKCYNTPYNDPKPRRLPTVQITAPVPSPPPVQSIAQAQTIPLERPMPGRDVPMAAMPVPSFAIEAHAS